MSFFATLARAIARTPSTDQARLQALETHIKALYDEAQQQRRQLTLFADDEARRAAEHATMVDQLSRLYRRVSARIAREGQSPAPNGAHPEESVMELRRRLGR